MPGRHNILNALAAIAIALEQGVEPAILGEAFPTFPGVARRFEHIGRAREIEVVDDYAHHPAEIRATLAGARNIHAGPIAAIFQPHRYTRTRDCWEEFTKAFGDADRVVIADIYAASEAPISNIDAEHLVAAIREAGQEQIFFGGSLDDIERDWPSRFKAGELVLTLGAGSISTLGAKLLAAIDRDQEGSR
jgi:UDP-N-acetylmuramate--alanine ligase